MPLIFTLVAASISHFLTFFFFQRNWSPLFYVIHANVRIKNKSKERIGFVVFVKVLTRRVSSRRMDAHFLKKHKENSPNLSYVYGKT